VQRDPTLRPGDIVSTKEGLKTFSGKNGPSAAFAPVSPSTLAAGASRPRLTPPVDAPEIDDEPGTIVRPQNAQPQTAPPAANPNGPANR
jgi:hypothetical protein